jgi:cytochrome c556
MTINILELNPKAKEYIETMKDIIDWSKVSVQEEFSRSANNRAACFKSILFQLELYRSIVQKRTDIKNDEVREKLENLKEEATKIYDKYPEKEPQPTDAEKESLFDKLLEIKKMII